jgi:hypothetical protein
MSKNKKKQTRLQVVTINTFKKCIFTHDTAFEYYVIQVHIEF